MFHKTSRACLSLLRRALSLKWLRISTDTQPPSLRALRNNLPRNYFLLLLNIRVDEDFSYDKEGNWAAPHYADRVHNAQNANSSDGASVICK
jgi:hypothetical protein